MKKILALFLLAMLVTAPAFAGHHRRHHRYHGGRPGIVIKLYF